MVYWKRRVRAREREGGIGIGIEIETETETEIEWKKSWKRDGRMNAIHEKFHCCFPPFFFIFFFFACFFNLIHSLSQICTKKTFYIFLKKENQ